MQQKLTFNVISNHHCVVVHTLHSITILIKTYSNCFHERLMNIKHRTTSVTSVRVIFFSFPVFRQVFNYFLLGGSFYSPSIHSFIHSFMPLIEINVWMHDYISLKWMKMEPFLEFTWEPTEAKRKWNPIICYLFLDLESWDS